MYHRGCWHIVGRCFFYRYRHNRSCRKRFTTQKAFVPHAALLRQAFAHCARFPTAASRRSLGRVSVPVWLIVLSDQLPVGALVGRYPANKLIGREPLPEQSPFLTVPCGAVGTSGISSSFPLLSRSPGQVAHVFRTRSPLSLHQCCHWMGLVRLACVRHAASVRPEPGSNSPSRSRKEGPEGNPSFDLESRRRSYGSPEPTGTETDIVVRFQCIDFCDRERPEAPTVARTGF